MSPKSTKTKSISRLVKPSVRKLTAYHIVEEALRKPFLSRLIIASMLFAALLFGYVAGAGEKTLAQPCEEPEASRIEQPTVKLENWPMRFEDGVYVLEPAVPPEKALCTWVAILTPSQSKVILNLALNPLGKPEFHLTFEEANGKVMANGMRPAKAELNGYWLIRGRERTTLRGRDGHNEEIPAFQPGGLLFAARPDFVQTLSAKKVLLDPPQEIANDIRTGSNYPWINVFNLDEASRRYLLKACLESLQNKNPKIRLAGVETLRAMKSFQKDATLLLIKAMRDPDKMVAGYAAESLEVLGILKTLPVPELADLLTNENVVLRVAAARALGSVGPGAQAAVPVLVKAALDDPYVRRAAIPALRAIGFVDDSVINLLLAALSDRNTSVQMEAAKTLFKFNRAVDKASGAVDALLGSNEVNDRVPAAEALEFLGSAGVPRLARILFSDPSVPVRYFAYNSLAAINTPEAAKTRQEYDATELSPRFWDKLVKLVSESDPNRKDLEPMLAQLRKGFLQWEPASCTVSAPGSFILYKKPDLRDQVVDLSTLAQSYKAYLENMEPYPVLQIRFVEYRDGLVRVRTAEGQEGWIQRSSFSCRGRYVADAQGRVLYQLFPIPRILERKRNVRFVSINGKPHLSFSSMDSQGDMYTGIALEIDPGTLAIVDVILYDIRAMGPPKIGRWPKDFPLNLFGGNCIGCFEIKGKVFLN